MAHCDAVWRGRPLHRFLVLPRVRVDNLASKALSLALRGLAERWEANHGCRPVLCETFIDPTRFDGACHRAANWETIGMTAGKRSGRGAKPAKEILVRPLDPEFRAVLKGETTPPPRPKRRSPSASGDCFAAMWSRIADAAADIAARRDETWMKRRRTLNTLIIMLFVFRLALSRGQKGYTTVTAELWDQCRRLGVALPQPEPVAISSIAKARARVHEDVFRDPHRGILARDTRGPDWNGHRTFAVDGSKINLPRPLAEAGYPLPNGGSRYPQGLLSCLYRLGSRMPADFLLTPGADERAAARAHLGALSPGDVVVFDRGYFSFVLLRDMTARGLHPVFRIQRSSAAGFDRFRDGDRDDALVRITPGKNALRRLKAAGVPEPASPIVLRLVRYDIGESRCVLATTLADTERHSLKDLSDLYHGRWGIEELFKISKTTPAVEEFHGRSERGGPPGALRPLQPDRHGAPVHEPRRRRAGRSARRRSAEDADELHKRAGHAGRQPRGADPDADVGAGRRREPRGEPGSRGPGAAAAGTVIPAPVRKTRRKVAAETTPDRVT